jgi:hypothetical protein
VLADRLRSALARIQPRISADQDRLRQEPVQAEDRERLRRLLQVAWGGVVFTTFQKFLPDEKGGSFPRLSDRRNIVVIADEAHRSQYGFGATVAKNKNQTGAHIVDGFAKHRRDRGRRRAPSQDAGGDPPFPGPTDGMLDIALT